MLLCSTCSAGGLLKAPNTPLVKLARLGAGQYCCCPAEALGQPEVAIHWPLGVVGDSANVRFAEGRGIPMPSITCSCLTPWGTTEVAPLGARIKRAEGAVGRGQVRA